MKLNFKAAGRLEHYCRRLRAAWYRYRFLFGERPQHQRLGLGWNVEFCVPVRGGGCGIVTIADGCVLGCPSAHRLGTGEILVQARTANAEILIGQGNLISNNVAIVANTRITIGDGCQIGDQVAIYDSDFHEICPATRNRSAGPSVPVSIGHNVWLGSRVMVLKGVSIGDNTIIGAGSVVTHAIPANCIAAGVPARVIRALE